MLKAKFALSGDGSEVDGEECKLECQPGDSDDRDSSNKSTAMLSEKNSDLEVPSDEENYVDNKVRKIDATGVPSEGREPQYYHWPWQEINKFLLSII